MPTKQRQYDWEEFWEWASVRGNSMAGVAERTGIDPRALYRWRSRGRIPEVQADRLALALGTMPGEVWSTWDADGEAIVEAAKERRRAAARRYHHTNRARLNKARNTRYWANVEAERARQRAYDRRKAQEAIGHMIQAVS